VLVDLTSAYDTVWDRGHTSQPQQQNPALLLRVQIPRNNVGQVAHVSPTPRVTSQKADIARRTAEEACAGSGWSAGATTPRIATLALVHSTAEYCSPVWCSIAHTRPIDPVINDALQIVTGCLRPVTTGNVLILADIQRAKLRRNELHCL